jgi:uncharacterized protein
MTAPPLNLLLNLMTTIKTKKPQFDCSQCPGYCCSHGRIAVSENDIARLAKYFGLALAKARKKFTYRFKSADADEQILRHKKDIVYKTICRFFDIKERRCTVYEARPNVCRKYPYGNRCGYYAFLSFERAHQDDEDYIPSA